MKTQLNRPKRISSKRTKSTISIFFIALGFLLLFSDLPPKRAHHALVYDEANKCILMTAGSTPLDSGKAYSYYNDLWCFDGAQWKSQGQAGDQRSSIGLAYDSKRKKVYSFGGYVRGRPLNDLRVLENGEWKTISQLTEMNSSDPGFVYDSNRDRLIVFGGSAGRGQVNSQTWEWDGKEWTKFNGTGPEGRQAFAMIYDSKRKKTVLYGGMGTNAQPIFKDTWEFDGSNWMKITEVGPGPRTSPGYAYDAKRGMMIIFGGLLNENSVGDTWGWDGKEWKKLADSGPSPRVMGYMAYDKNLDRIVLFGGRPRWLNDADDTWEWNGKQWTEIKIKQ